MRPNQTLMSCKRISLYSKTNLVKNLKIVNSLWSKSIKKQGNPTIKRMKLLKEELKSVKKNKKCKCLRLMLKLIWKKLNLHSKPLSKVLLTWQKINFQLLSLIQLHQVVLMLYWMLSWFFSIKSHHGLLLKKNSQIQVSCKDYKQLTRVEFQQILWKEFKSWLKIQRCKSQESIQSQKLQVVYGDGSWPSKGMPKPLKISSQRKTKSIIWCRNSKDLRMSFKLLKITSLKYNKQSITWLNSCKRPKATWTLINNKLISCK